MKATDFVKEHGIEKARECVEESPSWAKSYFLGIKQYESKDFSQSYEDCISIEELKRLVESYDDVARLQ